MRVQRYKGTRDLFPEEMVRFRLIEETFRDSCLKWGYREVKTPTIEYLHLFTSAGTLTPSMLGKVYSFLDWDGWSGERVVLRPDGTIPVARLYIDSMADKGMAKLHYVTNTFIFEETGKKTRERWQCGAELIGVGTPLADTELISLALEVLKRVKLENVELKLSHAGLIKSLLASLGLSPGEQAEVWDQILDGNTEALARVSDKAGVEQVLLPLLNLKGQSAGFLKNLKALSARSLPETQAQFDNFISIVELLESLGCQFQIDIASSAGFEYYTGIICQLFINEEKVGGGGRYDALIPAMGGGNVPASGFALYVDRLMNLVKPEALDGRPALRILVRAKDGLKEAFGAANRLRQAGFVAEIDLGEREPVDVRWVLDIQTKPLKFSLQDKHTGKQIETTTLDKVLKILGEESAGKDSPA